MYGLCFEGRWRWTCHLLLIIWLLLLAATPPKALGYFLGDTKAVLHGCEDHWTLQDRAAMPLLYQMTVCVDIRVTVPGAWVAFSYSSVHAPRPELGLEGDDKAVYGWLLRVRHRFPVELSPTEWHRVCLRRDVPRNSFSLEVDGKTVAARTVIAQAIPPSGSLWLGCQPRDRPPGAALGEVELYMFRMWNDLDDHGLCEDGTVIGWSAQYWGLTSPRARQRDPNLLCDRRRLRREASGTKATTTAGGRAFTTAPEVPSTTTTSSPVIAVTHMSNQTSQVTGPQLINCDIKQLCSQNNAYFWMSISVNATAGDKNEQDVQNLVSSAFHCNDTAMDDTDFCQAVEVNCVAKSNISTTTCDVLLQSSEAVTACEVQGKGVPALQHVEGGQIEVKIIREVERVGRYLCEDAAPSSGGFVRCTSTSSLEDICQANKASTVTCSLIESDSNPDPQPVSESCSREVPRFCNCTAFCNSQRKFFATRINITSDAVNVDLLQSLLSQRQVPQSCATMSACQDILQHYKKVHLECHGTQERLFSCMVILEMSGHVDICSLNELLQQLIGSNADITNDRPLTRMVICGPPDLSVDTLLKSNLTWVDSDLLTSNVCQPDPTLLKCEGNEVRAVLLNEGCPHTTQQTTTQPSTLTKTSITATPEALLLSVTNATKQTYTEAGNAAAAEKTNASHSTVQPNMTTPLSAINSTQSSTAQPVLQINSQNTTLSSVNSTLQITTTALIDSTLNTTTLSPNHMTVYNETTADTLRPSPNETSTTTSNSTIGTFTPSPTLVNNVTTATKNYTTGSNKFTEAYNVTTAHNNWNLHNGTTTISNTTIDAFPTSPNHTAEYSVTTVTPSPNHTADYNVTTITSYVKQDNSTITTTNTTISTVTSYPNYTTVNNVNTTTKNDTNNRNLQNGTTTTSNTTVSSFTTSPNHSADYNVTTIKSYVKQDNSTITTTNTTISTFTSSPNYTITTTTRNYTTASNYDTTEFNVTMVDSGKQQNGTTSTSNATISTSTTSPYHIAVYNVTTASNNYTDYNVMTADQNNRTITTSNATSTFTSSPNYTMVNNVTTVTRNHTTVYNVTTASNNYTTQYNVSTADNIRNLPNTTSNTTMSTFTNFPNHTADYNVTTTTSYVKHNSTITTTNTTISTFTSSPNYTTVNNVTTATKNYTTASNNYTTVDNVTTLDKIGNQQNGTTTTSNRTISTLTTPKPTVVYNVTTSASNYTTEYNVTTPSNNYTTDYNVMTSDNNNRTITTSNATISTSTSSPNYTMANNVTTATNNYTTDLKHYTTEYNVSTANIRNIQNVTTTTNNTTISTFTSSPNYTMVNNVTTATKNYTTAFNNYTTVDKVTTVDSNGNQQNATTTSNTTISTYTTSPNPTVVYNVTTAASNYTTQYNVTTASNNYTTEYNVTTADNIRNLQNGTTTTSNTTISTFTPSPNHTGAYNKTTTSSYVKQHNSTITTTNTTISTFTSSPNYTIVNNVTTATKNYTTVFNNYTTVDKVTTVDSNGNQQNATTTSNTTISTYTTSPNPTVVYNATIAASNYTTQYNVTTASNNYTTEYNVTTADNIRNLQNGTTTTSNTTISTFTPSPNHTEAYNKTTTSSHVKQHNSTITTANTTMSTFTTSNYTMASIITTATKNYTTAFTNHTTVHNMTADNNNGTVTTISTFTPSPNYTTVNNATTVSHKYTTAENVTTTTVSQNKGITYNVTTTTPHKNMTTSTAETLNANTSTKNSTVDNVTAVVDSTTKPTVAPLNNQTANHSTARVTYITTTSKSDTSSTTAANGNINHNETVGTSLNLSTTTSSLTTDLNLTTKRPVINLTTTVPSTTHGPPLATTITTTATTTATTTTATTITSTSTTTTKPATETTSTTTAKTTQSQEAQEVEANELLDQTQDASQLNSSQMAQLAGQLEKLLDGPTVPQAVGQKAVNIISNLMGGDSLALTASANRLIRVVDDLGLKLVVTGDKEIVSSSSLVLAVRTVDGTNFPTTSVDIFNTDNVQLSGVSRSRFKRSGSALGSVYLPSSLTTGLSPEEQQQASRVQFTYYTKSALFQDATLDNQTFVSPILGSSVANLSISNLSENIRFTIRNINPLQENYTASCVYWDFTLNDGRGGWSSNGCFVVNATPEETTCSCNHLTSFAILLDLSRDEVVDRQQAQILTFITYIGCGLSAIFLAVTLLTYLSFEKLLRDIPAKILVQLCISLLLLNLLFLLDGWLALYPATGLCISTAFFLHYFLLTSFTWAGLEALHMYLSVIRVFTPYLSRYMLKFSLMGWGIPLIVVIVVISVDKDNYGLVTYGKYTDGTTDDFCWLRNDIAFYVAVVGYFVLIFALCLLVFIMVMVQLARIKRQNPQNQSPNRGVMTDVRSIAGLVILLGLTWGFALFAWGPLYLPFVYLFTIFNTLQGFLVFVFHCAVKENVRRQWRTYLCCGRLRLAENSDWSRTATQNTRNISMATATTSAHRHPSRSSSVISDGTNSNGSMFLDSGISDGTGSDVVLNEIHRQNMSL